MDIARLFWMKLRHLVPIVVLVGAVLFLVFRPDEKVEDDQSKSEKARSAQAVPSSSSSGGEDGKFGRRLVSKRVLRDKPKVITTESGLRYEILTEGEGDSLGPSSRVKVDYSGTLAYGTVFDSFRERCHPAVFTLNQVV